jgi:hypothetical protein
MAKVFLLRFPIQYALFGIFCTPVETIRAIWVNGLSVFLADLLTEV